MDIECHNSFTFYVRRIIDNKRVIFHFLICFGTTHDIQESLSGFNHFDVRVCGAELVLPRGFREAETGAKAHHRCSCKKGSSQAHKDWRSAWF
ncbi:hypothetical protein AA0473_0258 [Acetobacter orleanensis NRIC 0473]|uniref:Uncharacterized protein n=1 Tax=Acetobacter orleanensis TaxID=104099 RepID=A0A4Y3TNQ2_9PROT|nr:hypothetical protein Abol_019_015 [Acetobacter orleanensis JCM 7639]GBR22939.1 hypothetical protein AA0473_0258 [Acetobacter orleanensis NRIC 0473]GEB82657.1 hypothetical protein AOR01nite_11340 [Acetobacter orleanensis]